MQGLAAAADLVARAAARRRLPPAAFVPLHAPGSVPPALAIDGSHAVLWDNGAVWVVAVRAAAVGPGRTLPVAPEVVAVLPDDAQATVDVAWSGCPTPPRAASAEAFAEALRAAREAEAAVGAAQAAPAGSLLLVDGALLQQPPAAAWASARVLEAAGRAGVRAVGVAKRSALAADVDAAHAPEGCWAAPMPGIRGSWVARLHPGARHVFRVDGALADVAALLPGCRDVAYPGYPYLLAKAHNAVALTGADVAGLRAAFEAEVRRRGPQAWSVLRDFHQVLDANVP